MNATPINRDKEKRSFFIVYTLHSRGLPFVTTKSYAAPIPHCTQAALRRAIDAMTIAEFKRPALPRVSCPAANASTSDLHKISLAQSNHEFRRMNTNGFA